MSEQKGLSLYSLTNEMMALLEEENVTEEMMEAAFGEIVKKGESCCQFLRSVEASVTADKDEEKRIAANRKAKENTIKRVKEYMQLCMTRMECDKLKTGTFSISIQDNPAALKEDDREQTPPSYRILVPATWEPDTAKIKDDLKLGKEVPGWRLEKGRSLRIR